jgi:PAS domain S-box-containing protein
MAEPPDRSDRSTDQQRTIIRIAIVYVLLGLLWLPLSDLLLSTWVSDPAQRASWDLISDLTFVVVSAGLLFGLLRRDRRNLRSLSSADWHSEQQYHALIEQAADGIFVTDRDGILLEVNPAFAELLEQAPEELVGQRIDKLILPEDLAREPIHLDELLAGQSIISTRHLRRKDGSYVLAEMRAKLIDDGRIQAVARDLTEREHTREALRQSEASFRLLFVDNPHPMWVYHVDTLQFLEVNEAALVHYGYARDEFLHMRLTDICPAEDVPQLLETARDIQPGRTQVSTARHLTQSGQLIDVEATFHSLEFAGHTAVLSIAQDITDRRRAEAALREAEANYRGIFENALEAVFQSSPLGRYLSVNPAMAHMYGYESPEAMCEQVTSIVQQIYVNPARRAEFQRLIQEHGQVQNFVAENQRRDGSHFWVSTNARAICDEQGQILYYEGFSQNITARKEAEEALLRSEQRFRELLENIQLVAVLLDTTGRVAFCNNYLLDLVGHSRREVIGKDWFETFVPAEERDSIKSEFFKNISSGAIPPHFENSILTRQAERRLILWNNTVLRDLQGNVIGTASIGEDVTEQRRAAEALRESEERYRTLAEAAHDMIFIIDREGRVQYVNSFAARYFNVQPDELSGAERGPLFPSPIDEQQRRSLQTVFETGKPFYIETETPFPDRTIWLGTWLAPMRDLSGQIVAVLGTARDITARKQTEKSLLDNETRLRRVTDNMLDLVAQFDLRGVFAYASPSHQTILGYAPDQLIGTSLLDFVHPDDHKHLIKAIQVSRKQGIPSRVEFRYKHADGHYLWLEAVGKPLYDEAGRLYGAVSGSRDITERKRAEEDLRRHDAILEAVSFAAERFLQSTGWEQSVQAVLHILGQAVDVSRVYVFENQRGESDQPAPRMVRATD